MSAPGLKITNFHYTNATFPQPDPAVRDYPKWVHRQGHPSVIAKDAREEAALLGGEPVPVALQPASEPAPEIILSGPNDERDILFQIAD